MNVSLAYIWTFVTPLMLTLGTSHADPAERGERALTLWYEQPAQKWVEALPVGNGRLGDLHTRT